MNIPTNAKERAKALLREAGSKPRQLVLLHTLAGIGVLFLSVGIQFLLSLEIEKTGGLSGMGIRSVLETAQTLISGAASFLLPFWELGILAVALRLTRQQYAEPRTLLSGFDRFFPALRLQLLRGFQYCIVLFLCIQFSTTIFMITPLSNGLEQAIAPLLTETAMENPELLAQQIMAAVSFWDFLPLVILVAVWACVLLLPLMYYYRMADYWILDAEKPKALIALHASRTMMRGNGLALLRLDLKFWWYYLLKLVAEVLLYADLLLPLLGISLTGAQATFLPLSLYSLVIFFLYLLARCYVETTYAGVYDALAQNTQGKESAENA